MIHEAMLLEYSGKKLALMEWASANKLIIFAAMLVNLYFPVGLASNLQFGTIALAITIFIAKLLVVYVAIAVLESVIAKLRFFRLPGLLFTAFILCLIAIGLVK
jgi:formate hydrogenlyase subunit 4